MERRKETEYREIVYKAWQLLYAEVFQSVMVVLDSSS